MTVLELIKLSLNNLGNAEPTVPETQTALAHLNFIISNFAYWDEAIQPIAKFDTLDEEIQLPPYYIEIFELLLSAREAASYGIADSKLAIFEAKAKQLTDRLIYRRFQESEMNPTTFVV